MATTENGICYPGDYNVKADIPAELKKMAESIDKNVQDNKYDDTEIKKDIQDIEGDVSDIKSEQETQNDLLERTQNALINITTPKSSNINVKDSSDLNAKVDVYGISEQNGEPSSSNIVDIENVTGDIDITVCNKNLFSTQWKKIIQTMGYPEFLSDNDGSVEIIEQTKTSIKYNQKNIYCGVSSDYIKVKKGQTFEISFEYKNINRLFITQYDETKKRIKELNSTAILTKTKFTTENDGYLTIAFSYSDANLQPATIEIKNILLALNEITGSFIEPGQQLITFSLAQGQRLADGDKLASDGIHHKRKQVELDGAENWQLNISNTFIILDFDNMQPNVGLCTHYKMATEGVVNVEYGFVISSKNIYIKDKDINTVEELKTYLAQQKANGTPVVLEYELAEEEIEAYTEEQQEAYDKLQSVLSYYNETNVFTDKAQLVFKYIADTKTYVDNETNTIKEQLNTINELLSTTATSATLLENLQSDLESEVT